LFVRNERETNTREYTRRQKVASRNNRTQKDKREYKTILDSTKGLRNMIPVLRK
jgi:hypothetical protein